MNVFLHKLGTLIAGALIAVGSLFGGTPAPVPQAPAPVAQNLGASNPLETPVALFHSALAAGISTSATTMTLTSALTLDGTTLASSTYAFVIDSGQPNQEFVRADCTGTTCTHLERGLSVITGTTTIASLQQQHRRNASVDIVDAPLVLKLTGYFNGLAGLPGMVYYASEPTAAQWSAATGTTLITLNKLTATAFGSSPVGVSAGGTGNTSLPLDMLLVGNGTSATKATSSPTVGYITATSTTATSTLAGQTNFTGYEKHAGNEDHGGTTVNFTGALSAGSLTVGGTAIGTKFGGDGTDGALAVPSGTTNIDLASGIVVVKNYTSISVSAGATLAFTNPPAAGAVVILRSQGACTIAGTVTGNFGSAGGAAPANATAGIVGSQSGDFLDTGTHYGAAGVQNVSGTGGIAAIAGVSYDETVAAAKALPLATSTTYFYRHAYLVFPGSGAGSGANNTDAGGTGAGAGGRGGGALILECGGAWNFTGTISVAGTTGSTASTGGINTNGGGGGGGGGGMLLALYNSLTANSGSVTVTGGNGGVGGTVTGTGKGGGGSGGGGGMGVNHAGAASGAGATAGNPASAASTGSTAAGTGGGTGGAGGGANNSGVNSTGSGGGGGGGGPGNSLITKNLWWY